MDLCQDLWFDRIYWLSIDYVTEARSAKVLITQHQMADVAIRHAVAFCAITLTA